MSSAQVGPCLQRWQPCSSTHLQGRSGKPVVRDEFARAQQQAPSTSSQHQALRRRTGCSTRAAFVYTKFVMYRLSEFRRQVVAVLATGSSLNLAAEDCRLYGV